MTKVIHCMHYSWLRLLLSKSSAFLGLWPGGRLVAMVYRVDFRSYLQKFTHFKQTLFCPFLSWLCKAEETLFAVVGNYVTFCHGRSSRVAARRVLKSVLVLFVAVFEELLSLSLLIASNFAIQVSKNCSYWCLRSKGHSKSRFFLAAGMSKTNGRPLLSIWSSSCCWSARERPAALIEGLSVGGLTEAAASLWRMSNAKVACLPE